MKYFVVLGLLVGALGCSPTVIAPGMVTDAGEVTPSKYSKSLARARTDLKLVDS